MSRGESMKLCSRIRAWWGIGLLVAAALLTPSAKAAVFFVDFGNSTYPSAASTYVDSNGNTWNNAINATAGSTLSNLRNTDGAASSIGVYNVENFGVNGGAGAGGLVTPNSAYLGDFAVSSATIDYWYVSDAADSTGRDLWITGLDPTRAYNLSLFGSRAIATSRGATFTVTGGNGTFSINQLQSGTDIGADGYDGNNNNITRFMYVTPDANNRITININSYVGDLGYLNFLGLEEAVPEPSTALFLLLGGALFRYARKRQLSQLPLR